MQIFFRGFKYIVLLSFGIVFVPTYGPTATLIVDTKASNCKSNGPGTVASPFCGIYRAVRVTSPGDLVDVENVFENNTINDVYRETILAKRDLSIDDDQSSVSLQLSNRIRVNRCGKKEFLSLI